MWNEHWSWKIIIFPMKISSLDVKIQGQILRKSKVFVLSSGSLPVDCLWVVNEGEKISGNHTVEKSGNILTVWSKLTSPVWDTRTLCTFRKIFWKRHITYAVLWLRRHNPNLIMRKHQRNMLLERGWSWTLEKYQCLKRERKAAHCEHLLWDRHYARCFTYTGMFRVKEAKQTGRINPILDPRWDPGFGWGRE